MNILSFIDYPSAPIVKETQQEYNKGDYPSRVNIIVDTETGNKYLFVYDGYEHGCGLTKLEE